MLEGSTKKYKKDITKEFIAMTRETKRGKTGEENIFSC
jgi:hypothetical protein